MAKTTKRKPPSTRAFVEALKKSGPVLFNPRVRYVKGGQDGDAIVIQLSSAATGGGRRLFIETTPERALSLAREINALARQAKSARGRHEAESFTFDAGELPELVAVKLQHETEPMCYIKGDRAVLIHGLKLNRLGTVVGHDGGAFVRIRWDGNGSASYHHRDNVRLASAGATL